MDASLIFLHECRELIARLNIQGDYKVVLYDFWLHPHNAHDLDLTEGIVEFSRTYTDFLICTPKIVNYETESRHRPE